MGLRVNSQPFFFALKNAYGFQTLSIGGRFVIRNRGRQFMLLRVIATLGNSEIYLRPRFVFSRSFVTFVARNFGSLVAQLFSKLRLIRRSVK